MAGVIVHEWFESIGGAEKVTDALAGLFPDAEIACLWNDTGDRYPGRPIRESWLAGTPLRRHKALALPLMPDTWRSYPGGPYDFVLSSSHAFAHHADFGGSAPRLAYVHTPARYLWAPEVDTRTTSPLVAMGAPALRRLDRRRAAELTSIAVCSAFVAERVARCWGLPARVVPPPVEVDFFAGPDDEGLTGPEQDLLAALPTDFLVGAARFVPFKRMHLVLDAAELVGLPVVLSGDGPLLPALTAHAAGLRVPAQVLRRPSRPLLRALLSRATALVHPCVEDFGIVPVEAMAAGTPVVTARFGGPAETVLDGETGVLVDRVEAFALAAAVLAASGLDPAACRARATAFDGATFATGVRDWVGDALGAPVGSTR